jgi:hypothetical protein
VRVGALGVVAEARLVEAEAATLGVAAQVETESKIEAKLKAVYHILVSGASLQALTTWVLIMSSYTSLPWDNRCVCRRRHRHQGACRCTGRLCRNSPPGNSGM